MCTLHDFTCMLPSMTVQDVKTKGNPVNLTAFTYWRCFNRNTHLKYHEFILAVAIVFSLCINVNVSSWMNRNLRTILCLNATAHRTTRNSRFSISVYMVQKRLSTYSLYGYRLQCVRSYNANWAQIILQFIINITRIFLTAYVNYI